MCVFVIVAWSTLYQINNPPHTWVSFSSAIIQDTLDKPMRKVFQSLHPLYPILFIKPVNCSEIPNKAALIDIFSVSFVRQLNLSEIVAKNQPIKTMCQLKVV